MMAVVKLVELYYRRLYSLKYTFIIKQFYLVEKLEPSYSNFIVQFKSISERCS